MHLIHIVMKPRNPLASLLLSARTRLIFSAIAFLFVATTFLSPVTVARDSLGRLSGQIINSADGRPVQGIRVSLQSDPPDEKPVKTTETDTFGFFQIKDILPGTYTLKTEHEHFLEFKETITIEAGKTLNRNLQLTAIDAEVFFDVFFQGWCLSTHVPLAGAIVRVEFWKPDGDIGGPPDLRFARNLDAAGSATFPAMVNGFYTFQVSKPGWEPLKYEPKPEPGAIIVGDKLRLIRSHFGSVFLRPIKTPLDVTVMGYDPVKNKPNLPLKGVTLNLIGYDKALKRRTVPLIPGFTSEAGTYRYKNLAPVSYQLEIVKLGYKTNSVEIEPTAAGQFNPVTVNLEMEPTKIKAVLSSIYQTSDSVKGAKVTLQGMLNSDTEGISRELLATNDPAPPTASVLFENLLPGRYWMQVIHETTITGVPNRSGSLIPGPNAFQVRYFPKETFGEVVVKQTGVIELPLDPVPARIRGRVFATDELGNVDLEVSDPEPNRIFHQFSHDRIDFMEHKAVKLIRTTNNLVQTSTDASGAYTALVMPGVFGVQMPTLANYTGHNIEFGDLTAQRPPFAQPWPYPDIWPYATFEGGHHGAGLRFDSAHEYQLDFFLHAHYINFAGQLVNSGEPFGQLVLLMAEDGRQLVTVPYHYLSANGAEIQATGTTVQTAPVNKQNRFVLKGMRPGTYTIALNNPLYDSAPVTVTVAPWQPPGILPAVAPGSPTYFFPGITHADGRFILRAEWKAKGSIMIDTYNFGGDPPEYQFSGSIRPQFFRMTGLPDQLFSFSFFPDSIPTPSYTVWARHGDGWFSSAGSGSQTFKAFERGLADNTFPNRPPAADPSYTLELRAVSRTDPNIEIPGVTVQFLSGTPRPAGGQVAHDGSPFATGATHSGGQWLFASSRTETVNPATRHIRTIVSMNRAMTVQGRLESTNGPIPDAAVVLRNRYGNPIANAVTRADGGFGFFGVPPQTVYLDVNRRGFIPQRKRYSPPSPAAPDIRADLTLETVPAPILWNFDMNRYGMFLPGVTKSGDSKGFNSEHARRMLTTTWESEAEGEDFQVKLEGFFNPDETQKPAEEYKVSDQIAELWIVDRRAFTNAFVNEKNQKAFQLVEPPSPLNYVTVKRWLDELTTGKKDGKPYFVVHRQLVAKETDTSQFRGEIYLPDLPSGEFKPMLVALTDAGGVAVMNYSPPAGREALLGMNLPEWASGILNAVGTLANFPTGEKQLFKKYEAGFLKIGSLSFPVESRIGLNPFTASPVDDATLTYKYVMGIDVPLGEGNAETGPFSLAPKFLGLQLRGATLEFEASGEDKKAALAIVFVTGKPDEVEKVDSSSRPAIGGDTDQPADSGDSSAPGKKKSFEVTKNEFKAQFKAGITEKIDADDLGNNILSGFGIVLEAQGTYDLGLRINATPVVRLIPYAGPVLQAMDSSGAATIYALFETTIGAKYTFTLETEFPKPASEGTTVSASSEAPRTGILGGLQSNKEIKFILRLAGGLQISAAGGLFEGSALFQFGAPSGTPDVDGIFFTLNNNPTNSTPLFTKIEGAFSFILRAAVNLWATKIEKQWKWDIARFVIDRQSEPYFELTPIDLTYTVLTAGKALQERFAPAGPTLIDRFYGAGSFHLADSTNPWLAYTGTDPKTGRMTLWAARREGPGWSNPVLLANAAGILSVATAQLTDGSSVIVWSEISTSDVANPYPSSSLKFVASNTSGSSWGSPETITNRNEAMFQIKIASAGAGAALAYLSTSEGPLGERQTLHALQWNGAWWESPATLISSESILAHDIAGHPSGRLAVAASTPGGLKSFTSMGGPWSRPQIAASAAGNTLSLRFTTADYASMLWENAAGGLDLSTLDFARSSWSPPSPVVDSALTDDCELLVLPPGSAADYLAAWSSSGKRTTLQYAYLDFEGLPLAAPAEASVGSDGRFTGLALHAEGKGAATLLAHYTDAAGSSVRTYPIKLAGPGDCNGNAIPDIEEIRVGILEDCNQNGVSDYCDIASGSSRDDNRNGVPDECEPARPGDCNRNGIADSYELALGIGDTDRNGVLDACELSLKVRILSFPSGVRERYYRAAGLRVRSRNADSFELEYSGTLEQSSNVTGPWLPAE